MATASGGPVSGPPGRPAARPPAPANLPPEADEVALAEVMKIVPRGALALAGLAVALLLAAWFAVYVFIFLPRGPVG